MSDNDKERMFKHWNPSTKLCYSRKMICQNCPNLEFCNNPPWNKNPYGIKNIKYATMQTLKNIGVPDENM